MGSERKRISGCGIDIFVQRYGPMRAISNKLTSFQVLKNIRNSSVAEEI
jgi:hypothetical protein